MNMMFLRWYTLEILQEVKQPLPFDNNKKYEIIPNTTHLFHAAVWEFIIFFF